MPRRTASVLAGDQGVAGEQHPECGEAVGDGSLGMSRHLDGPGPAGDPVEALVAAEGARAVHRLAGDAAHAGEMQRAADCRGAAQQVRKHGAFRLRVAHGTPRPVGEDRRVGLVDPDVGANCLDGADESGLIEVAMCEQGRSDVPQRPPGACQVLLQLPQVAKEPGATSTRPSGCSTR